MDIQKALNYTENRCLEILLETEIATSKAQKDRLNREFDFLQTAREALEMRKPEKPTEDNRYYGNGKCPCCGVVFMDKSTCFCGNCGQALDWT